MYQTISALGFFAFAGLAWLVSSNRKSVPWRTVAWGISLQLIIGVIIFRLPFSRQLFIWLNDGVLALLSTTNNANAFLFGPLAAGPGQSGSIGFILVFQVLPVIIFFSALTALLYHLGILQPIVRMFARIFHRSMGTSGAESLCGASNIFVGVESALVVRPYLEKMTRSELLTILTAGMSTVASSTLGLYVVFLSNAFPQIAGHLLSASLLSIPAAIVISKIMLPENEQPETMADIPAQTSTAEADNFMGAIIHGAMEGLKLAAGIIALLVAILSLVALLDMLLAIPGQWLGLETPLTLSLILSWIFYPLAALLGIAPADIPLAAQLLGERVIMTEVVSYQNMATMVAAGNFSDPRSVVVLSYALCGFAHVASVSIFVGGIAVIAPSRRDDLAALGFRALLAATLATLMTAAVAGMLASGESVLFSGVL